MGAEAGRESGTISNSWRIAVVGALIKDISDIFVLGQRPPRKNLIASFRKRVA